MVSKVDKRQKIFEREVEGKRLGRHLHHDPRSINYPVSKLLDEKKPLVSKTWRRWFGPLDQGNLGSCTGNACTGMIGTDPVHRPHAQGGPHLTENTAIELYELATQLDEFGGTYPPEDTGSSTLGVLKAAQQKGYITSYFWGFGIRDMQYTVSQLGAPIVGTNWYEGMDNPDASHTLHVTGDVRGGHEYEIVGIDIHRQAFIMENSWGIEWGNKGRAYISWHDMDRLLSEDGEVGIGRR